MTQQNTPNEAEHSIDKLLLAILQLTDWIEALQAMVNLQSRVIAQLLQDSRATSTMASSLPSQIESVISRVDSSITTASELCKAYVDDIDARLQLHMHNTQHENQHQINKTNLEYTQKYNTLFANMAKIGNCYNGVCTS
jgi:hypothetical protein